MMERKRNYIYDASFTQEIRYEHGDTYGGYKIIGRDMDVRGGVSYRTGGGEAILVDPDSYPDAYWDYFNQARDRARDKSGQVMRLRIPGAVFNTVRANMPYSEEGVARVCQEFGSADGQIIELSAFMQAGAGLCRHQALACAALLENFKEFGYMDGEISVDRNKRWNPHNEKDKSGHAWTRITGSNGAVYILDVAQGFIGSLEESTRVAQWNYLRPEEELERSLPAAKKLGRTGIKGVWDYVHWFTMGD